MSLYGKYRPRTFDEVIGQDHITKTLKNQIINDQLAHAYLFCGIRGTGKTTLARILAKAVNCENPKDGNPCLECETCKAISDASVLNVLEIDAASNTGVDDVRNLRDDALYMPQSGKYKAYIIDEVHMLSKSAFNALLKILEEPPKHVIFILATTESQKIPATILSRCQRFDLKRIPKDMMKSKMREYMDIEKIAIEDEALDYIAELSEGSMRDGLSILELVISIKPGEEIKRSDVLEVLGNVDYETYNDFTLSLDNKDIKNCIEVINNIYDDGKDIVNFASMYCNYLRKIVLLKAGTEVSLLDMSEENASLIKEVAAKMDKNKLIYLLEEFINTEKAMRYANMPKLTLEMLIIRLCKEEEYIPQGAMSSGNPQAAQAEAPKKVKPRISNRVETIESGDLDGYIGAWNALVDATENVPVKVKLNSVKFIRLEGNNIYMSADLQNAVDYVRKYKERLEQTLPKLNGKVIEINIELQEKLEKAVEESKNKPMDDSQAEDLANMLNIDVNITE